MMKILKGSKSLFWVVGGLVAVAASAYAAKRLQVWIAWREEDDLQETEREIEEYEQYVHANGGKRRKARDRSKAVK